MSARIYTLTSLAAELRADDPKTPVTRKTLVRFVADGMAHIRVGRTIYLKREDYDAFIEARRTTAYAVYHPAESEETTS